MISIFSIIHQIKNNTVCSDLYWMSQKIPQESDTQEQEHLHNKRKRRKQKSPAGSIRHCLPWFYPQD